MGPVEGLSCGDQLPICLRDEGVRGVLRETRTRKVGRHPPAAAEAEIGRAIGVVARDDELTFRRSCDDDLAVLLPHDGVRSVVATADVSDRRAVISEVIVETPVGVVAGEHDVGRLE